jgi:hypothetical protein
LQASLGNWGRHALQTRGTWAKLLRRFPQYHKKQFYFLSEKKSFFFMKYLSKSGIILFCLDHFYSFLFISIHFYSFLLRKSVFIPSQRQSTLLARVLQASLGNWGRHALQTRGTWAKLLRRFPQYHKKTIIFSLRKKNVFLYHNKQLFFLLYRTFEKP